MKLALSFSRAFLGATCAAILALSVGCSVEPAPIEAKQEAATAVKVAPIQAAQAAAPSAPEAPAAPTGDQPASCCGGGSCGQAQAKADGAMADCPCKAAARAAGLPVPSCGGG